MSRKLPLSFSDVVPKKNLDMTRKLPGNLPVAGLRWVKTLGTAASAIHDAVATVELHGIVDPGESFVSELVA